ncbi:MAG: electron transfer flavoprotein subunit alpha/FixB family protein [Candidatus Eisenbacteria bacterium]|nr:electron transfer flavoprotein subunit alpha/FixB family protein [Candidatus Latescibacterota bacterium]MBD3301580.1 electron transfer flavoprotein subunit alpha/FixB family protein [Candidatus Eisenbacteria bacterium]
MRKIFVVAEIVGGAIDDSAFEMAGAARRLAESAPEEASIAAVLLGSDVAEMARKLAERFDEVVVYDDPSLEAPDGGVSGAVLADLFEKEKPLAVLIAHSNNGMDLAPALAVRLGMPMLADCLTLEWKESRLSGVRTVYAGKVHARVTAQQSDAGVLATVRPGAMPMPEGESSAGTVRDGEIPADRNAGRRSVRVIAPEAGEVDLTQAEKLVAVGRGIEDEENLEIVQSLAASLGAELACSRPIVDKNWLPKSRQVGTSGVSVKPKIYLAVGISGSFQHMGGVKGRPFLVAINKDPRAPIFGTADLGIVGDLLEIVPLLEEKVRAAKG